MSVGKKNILCLEKETLGCMNGNMKESKRETRYEWSHEHKSNRKKNAVLQYAHCCMWGSSSSTLSFSFSLYVAVIRSHQTMNNTTPFLCPGTIFRWLFSSSVFYSLSLSRSSFIVRFFFVRCYANGYNVVAVTSRFGLLLLLFLLNLNQI